MRSTTTDRTTKKQELIEQKRGLLLDRFPSLWSAMIADWNSDDQADAGWLMYSANYLFRTRGVRWAVDPLNLRSRIQAALQVDARNDLEKLSLVILTHEHNDHLDLNLIRELKDLPIRWIVPRFLVEKIRSELQLSPEKIVIPKPLQPLTWQGLTILPFEGQHLITHADGTCKGVPEMGYLVEQAEKRWLFPGDTRVYDISRFPKLGPVDVLFAHLWLGHGSALREHNELLEPFCDFCASLQPKKVLITHLEEFGRKADDFFDEEHVQKVKEIFSSKYDDIACTSAYLGDKVLL
jgi:L-ascorbate metabolism protein UlaG (beta-lactamase superfamily)